MTCNLASCLVVAQLMQYSYSDSYKKNILLRTRNCTSHLLTLKRRSIAYQEKSSGGPCENLAKRNGLCDSCRLCTTTEARVDNTYSDEFGVKVGVHQGSVLSPLLFVIVLKALSREFRTGTPWELLYADDLVMCAETEEGLKMKLNKWKTEMEVKGLRINMGKTKIMVSGVNLQTLKDSGEYPCSVCRKGVGSNSIYCAGCSHWVHKKCSGVIGRLKSNPDYRCSR